MRKQPIVPLLLTLLAALGLFLLTRHMFEGGEIGSPAFNLQALVLAVLTLLNGLLILTLLVMLCRYLVKALFERRSGQRRASFRSKLTFSFLILAILPTAVFVLFAYIVINESVIQWFSAPAEELLRHTVHFAEAHFTSHVERARAQATHMWEEEANRTDTFARNRLEEWRRQQGFDAWRLLGRGGRVVAQGGRVPEKWVAWPEAMWDPAALAEGPIACQVVYRPWGDALVCRLAHPRRDGYYLELAVFMADPVAYRAFQARRAHHEYLNLKTHADQIRLQYFAAVGFGGMILLLAFVWLAIFISKTITQPVDALVAATRRVAAGELEEPIPPGRPDEIGAMIEAFNGMMDDLRRKNLEIDQATQALTETNQTLADQSRFIQTVLDSVATGVVSLNAELTITSSNSAARNLLKQRNIKEGVSHLADVVPQEKQEELRQILQEARERPQVSREVHFQAGRRMLHFVVTASRMHDATGALTGFVIVFDDVSDLIRHQRNAAWQEVAKRLAHEIKNPLTPLQLSVERIRKQFVRLQEDGIIQPNERTRGFGRILEEASATVMTEARTLNRLVDEFSRFARLPAPDIRVVDLNELVAVWLRRYQAPPTGIPEVTIEAELDPEQPVVLADRELLGRVVANLVDNAVEAVRGGGGSGRVVIRTCAEESGRVVRLMVEDDGPGLPEGGWDALLMPYVSTKEDGTGLGLAVVKKIIDDHQARMWAENLTPRGCRVTVALPVPDPERHVAIADA